MKRLLIISLCVILLSGCAQKVPQRSTVNRQTGELEYVPQTDYQAYALAKSHEPKSFRTFELSGAKFIKIKGDSLTLALSSEFKQEDNAKALQAPQGWYSRTMDSLDRAFPWLAKGFIWYQGLEAFKFNQEKVAKDPVVVDQRHDTVTTHNTTDISHTDTAVVVPQREVEVVNQQEVILVDKPLIIETPVHNGNINNGTINNTLPEPVEVP